MQLLSYSPVAPAGRVYKNKELVTNRYQLSNISQMRSIISILICCLYALIAVNATPFTKRQNAEVQQGNNEAAEAPKLWSDDKDNDNDKDDKWSKDDYGGDHDCASRSVSVLIGTSTYAIPCLQGDSIVNLNGLIPTPTSSIASSSATEASSSAVSSSAASSSEASSSTDSTTTTTDSTTNTSDTTTSADSSPTFAVNFYGSQDCTFYVFASSLGSGCFDHVFAAGSSRVDFSVGTTSTTAVIVNFYFEADCAGIPYVGTQITSDTCSQHNSTAYPTLSYSVTTV
ncbi:unnamed protein product [Umbelopsis ramanniana]